MAEIDPLKSKDTLLGGKYRLGPVIGSGGVATVYRATHLWTEREVAVKLLDPTLPHFDRIREGFLREARATVQLDHPNVVDVLDMGEDDWETVYLVMELLEGPTLRDVLLQQGRLEPKEALAILLPLVNALNKAHELGIVHRDFKPENIMLTPDAYGTPTPKLLDFGVAEILQDARARNARGWGDVVMGTPQYMAPEQARDERTLIGPRTDVWGVGVVLYECLTGNPPFDGDSALETLHAVCDSEIDFDSVPPDFVPVLQDALEQIPQKRIASLSILKERIEYLGFTSASTPPPEPSLSSWSADSGHSGIAQHTWVGLGGAEPFPLTVRVAARADTEAVEVPFRSHRNVALAGVALALAVAFAAWWTVRQPNEVRRDEGDVSVQQRVAPIPVQPEPPEPADDAPPDDVPPPAPAQGPTPAEAVTPPEEPSAEAAASPPPPEEAAKPPARRKRRRRPATKPASAAEPPGDKPPDLVTEW